MSESSTSLSPLTDNHLEFTVLMPCLNESAALAICVHQALEAMRANGIRGEVLVADNGSTDGSQRIAAEQGARIVPIGIRGQGNALRGAIAAARGKYILMGDADGRREGVSTNLWLQQIAGGPPHQLTHLPDDVIAYA